jgi:hypothetical protein
VARIERIIWKLNKLGVAITADQVFKCADGAPAGRMHIGRVMVEYGFASNVDEAFIKYLRNGGPAYEGYSRSPAPDVIEIIKKCGGLSFLAHPGNLKQDGFILQLKVAGLNGIEAYHCDHTASQVSRYQSLAKKEGLLISGGSDFHGKRMGRNAGIGESEVPDTVLEVIKRARIK